jgi:hypothetical protein
MGRYSPCRKYKPPEPIPELPRIEYKGYDKLYEYYLGVCLKCSEQTENAINRDIAIRSVIDWYLIQDKIEYMHIDKQIYKIIAKKHDKDVFIDNLVKTTRLEIVELVKAQEKDDIFALYEELLSIREYKDINPEIVYIFEDWVKQLYSDDKKLFTIQTDHGGLYRRDFIKLIAIYEVLRDGKLIRII